MATIEQLYQQILGRPADPGGLAYYQNLFGPTIEPEEVNRFLSGAVASREVADIGQLQPAAQSFISSLSRPAQSEADIRRQVEADVAEFIRARDAGESTAGIGRPLDRSQIAAGFTAPTPEIAADLIGRSQTVGVRTSEFDKYGGYQAVKDVYNASVGDPVVQPTGVETQNVTVNPPTTTVNPPTPTGFQGASRDDILGLYRSIGILDPSDTDVAFWQNFSRTNPDVLGAANPMTQLTNAFRAASRQSLKSDPLPTTGESNIDPLISPYLSESLGVARNLFLTGEGPELYPGQMYVSPSTATLDAIMAAENLGRSTTVSGLGEDVFGAYAGGLGTLANLASPDYMKSQDYKDYVSSITRPITEAVTEDIIPGIQSGFSMAGRYGSGAMGDITAKATGRAATAIGDVTSRIAQQERQNQFSAVTALPGFLSNLSGVTAGALAPSGILAGVGAQREAISGQPLQEAIRRFEYGEQLPYNQLAGYISSIYGSPLANRTASPQLQSNDNFQNIGALLNLATAVPSAVTGVKTGYDFLSGLLK
jgi:hypothetical protein